MGNGGRRVTVDTGYEQEYDRDAPAFPDQRLHLFSELQHINSVFVSERLQDLWIGGLCVRLRARRCARLHRAQDVRGQRRLLLRTERRRRRGGVVRWGCGDRARRQRPLRVDFRRARTGARGGLVAGRCSHA